MRFKINDEYIEILRFYIESGALVIKTTETIDSMSFLEKLGGCNSFSCVTDSGDILQEFNGKFNAVSVELMKDYTLVRIPLPQTTIEEVANEVVKTKTDVTNLELALCEIYESLGVQRMVKIYINLIKKGLKTIDDVPEKLKAEVIAILESQGVML